MSSENQQLLVACQYKTLVHKITIPVTVIISIITNFTLIMYNVLSSHTE